MTVTYNIKTSFGASSATGVEADNATPAFAAFRDAARLDNELVRLILPGEAGEVYSIAPSVAVDQHWTAGIPNLQVIGSGNPLVKSNTFFFGCHYPIVGNDVSARIVTATAGQSTLQLVTVGDATKFVPGRELTRSNGVTYRSGQWILVMAMDTQGEGTPLNPFYFEYAQILSVNLVTGVITLTAPLKGSYLSTFPLYDAGASGAGEDKGGPATIYALDETWDCNHLYTGFRLENAAVAQFMYARGRNIEFRKVTCASAYGIIPSWNDTMILDRVTQPSAFLEPDKIITNFIMRNGSTANQVHLQSASIKNFRLLDNSTIAYLNGTARNNLLVDSTISTLFKLGVPAYGRCDDFIAINSSIPTPDGTGVIDTDVNAPVNGWTITNGVIRRPKSFGPVRWGIPDTFVLLRGSKDSETGFIVNSVTEGGTDTIIGTTLTGNDWPTVPLQGGTRLDVMALPAAYMSLQGCTGSADAIDMSQAAARGRPYGEYSKRSYTGNTLVTPSAPFVSGRIQKIEIIVSQAYTGAQGTLTLKGGSSQVNAVAVDGSGSTWNWTVNLKVAGTRTYLPGVGWTGAQSGDALTDPGNIWMAGAQQPSCSANVSGEAAGLWPIVSIEYDANQGLPATTRKTFMLATA